MQAMAAMAKHGKCSSKLLLLIFVIICINITHATTDCMAEGYNLTALSTWGAWHIKTKISNQDVHFFMNPCGSLRDSLSQCNAEHTSICMQNLTANIYTIIGNVSETLQPVKYEHSGGFRLDFRGAICPSAEESNQFYNTSINFKCGNSLGSPVLLESSECSFFIEWHSTVACDRIDNPAVVETRCYLYDNKDRKHDFTPLIKQSSGYLAVSNSDYDFYINVCRNIQPDGPTASCPKEAAACRVSRVAEGDGTTTAYNMGVASNRELVALDIDHYSLHYEYTDTIPGCNGHSPTTTITFVCPREDARLGGSRAPVVISDFNCQFHIEWQTEYACESEMLTSQSCVLDSGQYGIDIDLSPLTKTGDGNYRAPADGYTYYLNVCDKACSNQPTAGVCQLKDGAADGSEHNAGKFSPALLRYVDGELSLTYKGGDKCSSGFERTSVITFKCNETAAEGTPTFITETSCTYFFEWRTRYACHEHPTCQVTDGTTRYDLGSLEREGGQNWVALNSDENESGTFLLNVCGSILRDDSKNKGSTTCNAEAAACYLELGASKGVNIGAYKTSPVFKDNHLQLTYVHGDPCDNKQKSTIITFSCSPGDLESAPVFIRKSNDDCLYEFEWRTAAACSLAEVKGHDCIVYDDEGGVTFDLTPLKGTEYQANVTGSNSQYNYYVGVCAPLKSGHCGSGTDVGVCQSKTTDDEHITGRVNSNSTLEYYDGVLKLTYYNGDNYHAQIGQNAESRKTEIVFLCDADAPIDSIPMYMNEGNHTYFFKWYTRYACPAEPVECMVSKGDDQQYDLSSLSASKALDDDNWSVIDDTVEGHRYKFYLHVCKPLNSVAGCGALSSACMMEITPDGKEKSVHSNLGVSKSSPVIESVGHVMLTYSNGNSCGNGKLSETRIHFICVKGALATSPRLLEKIDGCDYIFEWKTEAACPIETSLGTDDCTVKDINSGYTFNLSPLKMKSGDYSINNGASTFMINICGSVPSNKCNGVSNAGACLTDSGGTKVLGQVSSKLEFTDDGHLSLIYKMPIDVTNGNSNSTVEITFLCRHDVSGDHHGPTFLRQDGHKWLFNFETPYACLPQAVDCLIADSRGNEYDLTPLAKENGNWEVVDTRDGSSDLRYHINVCRPLNNNQGYNCPGGAIGSCQTSTSGKPVSLGYIQSMPEAAPDGSISIQYENGDMCKDNVRYSTRIIFECSDRPGSPVLQVVSNDCEFVFSWQTPVACPLKSDTGTNCVVNDPELGFQFNLSSLHNSTKDYIVKDGDYEYHINPCGNLVSPSGNCKKPGIGACQVKPSDTAFSKIAGMSNTTLVYEGGRFKLNYTGGEPCHNNVYERSTTFIFYCDKQVKGPGEPKFIKETNDCTYVFEWATPLACPPFDLQECSYRNSKGTQFDLSSLTRMDGNYKIIPFYHTNEKRDVFYMNVCRPLVHSHNVEGSNCTGNSAACLQTGTAEHPRYTDLGHLSGPPTWNKNHLTLTYEGGDACGTFEDTEQKYKRTTIAFICDKDAEATGPEYAFSGSSCYYYFNWVTELACGLDQEKISNDCTVTNPATGYRFDLSSLNKQGGYEVSGGGYIYKLNICGALTGSSCADENNILGVCQEQPPGISQHPYDAGKFNRHLSFDDGILMLNYEDGKPCHQSQFNRSSIINFVCPHTDEVFIGQPVFVDESEDCTYYFSWHTSLACENQISCKATNGINTVDLSPLVNEQGYYLSTNLDPAVGLSAVYLNPCRPLNPIPGIRCPPSAAGCVAKDEQTPFSIGRLSSPPVLQAIGKVTLTYTNGSSCPADNTRNLSTIIQFSCDPGTSDGTPELTSIDDCTYHFIWKTSRVCAPSKPDTGTDCKYTATNLDYTFDLTPLSTEVEELSDGYSIRICKPVSDDCDGAVCLTSGGNQISLGSATNQEFSYTGHNLKVKYTNGDGCPVGNGKRQSEIIFECDESAGRGKPELVTSDDEACYYSFFWKSTLVCPPMHRPCDLAVGEKFYDLHALSRATSSWQVKSNEKTYYLNLCTPIINGPSGCDQSASVCSEASDLVESLGMEYTQQLTADTVLNKPSDLKMVFSEGHSTDCPGKTTTKITFTCGKNINTPVFKKLIQSGSTCEYNFVWNTRVACPQEIDTVKEKDGKFTDPFTNEVIDINQLKSKQQTAEEIRQDTTYTYYISLDGDVSLPKGERSECKNAAICQTNPSDNFYRNIGSSSKKIFYMSDDTLEMVVTNPGSCHNGGDVNSTIIFQCDTTAGLGKPEFQYESIKCHYFFTWRTSKVCTTTSDHTSLSSSVGGSHNASIVIAVFATLIVICCLALYFHEHERRVSFGRSIKRCFPGGYSNIPSYKYTKLSSEEDGNDDEASLLEDVTPRHLDRQRQRDSFFNDNDDELLGDVHPSPMEYHDDSDEELLPTI